MTEPPVCRPAFSELERRLDPSLAAADTNALFEAFRRRRKVHRRGLFDWRATVHSAKSLLDPSQGAGSVVLVLAGMFVGIVVSQLTGWSIFFYVGLAAGWGAGALLRSGRTEVVDTVIRLPNRLSGVLGVGRGKNRGETDIWMTGASGEDVMEALYLEGRESSLVATGILFGVLAVAATAVYYRVVMEFRPGGVALVGSMLFLAWRLTLASFVAMGTTHWQMRLRMSMMWRDAAQPVTLFVLFRRIGRFAGIVSRVLTSGSAWWALLRRVLRWLPRAAKFLLAGTILTALVLAIGFALVDTFSRPAPVLPAWFRSGLEFVGIEIVVAVGMLVVAMLLPLNHKSSREQCAKMRERALTSANRHYNLYMAVAIMGDHDAALWVDDVYPADPRDTLTGRLESFLERSRG